MANIATIPLKTGKENISFSELKDWRECSWEHKLKHVDKINLFEENVYTNFGTGIHDACEDYLLTRKMKYEIALDTISQAWEEFDLPEMGLWMKRANLILEAVPSFLNDRFPGWDVFSAEEELMEKIPKHENVKFKGFIDAVIKHKDEYWIVDWKTSGNGWNDWKKNDKNIRMQLLLYHKFWSEKHGIDPKKVKVGFVILNRELDATNRIDFFTFDVKKQEQKKSLNVVNEMVTHVKNGRYFKRWKYKEPRFQGYCRFCDYNNTEHCP